MNDRPGAHGGEFEELFEDPADRHVARDVQRFFAANAEPPAEPDPVFRMALRRRLLEQAGQRDAGRVDPAPVPWYRRLARTWGLAAAGAAAAALLIALGAATRGGPDQGVRVGSPLDHSERVSVVEPITLTFDQPMDPDATERAVAIEPATNVGYRWTSPRTLEIQPESGSLAPATRYQVTVRPAARTADERPLSQEVRISFVTGQPGPAAAGTPSPAPAVSSAPSPTPSASPSPSPSVSPSPSASPSPSVSPSPSTSPSTSPAPSRASPSPR